MGGRYCTINSPRGSRWGQKSRDRRSRDFCPHRGPSGELIAQYRAPMSFCFYPTLYLGNHFYFWSLTVLENSHRKHKSRDIQRCPLNYACRYGDATTFTCDVIMVPVVTRAPNITNISCRKIAPKPLVYIDPRILLNYCTFILGKTIKDWIERYVSNSGIFPKLRCLFHQSYLTVWGFTIVLSQFPIFPKLLHSFVDSCIWTICHHTDFTGRVHLLKNFISPRNNLFHTHKKRFFLARYISPNGPHLFRMVQPIRSPENPGTTVVSIGHLTPWPENPGYRTQVWDYIS